MDLNEFRSFIKAIGGPENYWNAFGRQALVEIRSRPRDTGRAKLNGDGRVLLERNRRDSIEAANVRGTGEKRRKEG